jgi:hypothetical protein
MAQEFLPHFEMEEYSSILGSLITWLLFRMCRERWILISTAIYGNETAGSERNYKPDIALHYNSTKGALTIGDQMAGEHSCIRGTKKMAFIDFS